jgi:Na+-transporting NADH:ubiquinone oxidoreductase subunit D
LKDIPHSPFHDRRPPTLLTSSEDGRGMAAPPTLGKHTMWEAVPPGDSWAGHGGQRKSTALQRPRRSPVPGIGQTVWVFNQGLWANNPISVQVLGICSALAVTNRLANALVMAAALLFVGVASSLFVSLLREATPRRIRMIAEVMIIATFVVVFDQLLKAFYWDMSKQLGPYVGLIITNCIIMGRAEAFASHNPPFISALDGAANGIGYGIVLALVASLRELLGSGTLLGYPVLSADWYTPNQLLVLAPGAFLTLAFLIALFNAVHPTGDERRPT